MKCPVCGAENEAGAVFCYQCGSPLRSAGSSEQPATGRTVALSGDEEGTTDDLPQTALRDRRSGDALGELASEERRPPVAVRRPSSSSARTYRAPAGRTADPYARSPWPTAAPTSTLATFALILGILSFIVLPFIGGIGAVILGHMARGEIRASGGQVSGEGQATAGLVLGYINLALSLIGFLMLCLPFAVLFSQ